MKKSALRVSQEPRAQRARKTHWLRRAVAAVGVVASFGAGCGSKAGGDPCETVYAGQCGGACRMDGDCTAGVYCGPSGVCTADCGPGAKSCDSGSVCTSKGRCQAGAGFTVGSTGGLGDGGACAETKSRGEGLPADLYIMNDQSASMSCAIPTGGDRWDAMKSALTQFLQSPDATGLGVGIQYFGLDTGGATGGGGRRGGGGGGTIMGSCDPATYTPADVEIAPLPTNATPIVNSLNAHGPSTYTPTPAALTGAINHARMWATAHPSDYVAVVLATDGEPNIGLCNDNDTTPTHLIPIVTQIAAAGFSGMPSIPTYVIGIVGGSAANGGMGCNLDPAPPNQADLDSVANGGGTGSAFIVDAVNGNTAAQFLDALNKIRGNATVPCEYRIPTPTNGGTVDLSSVNVDFTPTGGTSSRLLQAPDSSQCPAGGGWYYDNPAGPTKILICGATCDSLKADATAEIDILLGCKTAMTNPK